MVRSEYLTAINEHDAGNPGTFLVPPTICQSSGPIGHFGFWKKCKNLFNSRGDA